MSSENNDRVKAISSQPDTAQFSLGLLEILCPFHASVGRPDGVASREEASFFLYKTLTPFLA